MKKSYLQHTPQYGGMKGPASKYILATPQYGGVRRSAAKYAPNDPPKAVIDENMSRWIVDELGRYDIPSIYMGDKRYKGTSDAGVKKIGKKYGEIPIVTKNRKHFQDYDPLIEVMPGDSDGKVINEILKYLGY